MDESPGSPVGHMSFEPLDAPDAIDDEPVTYLELRHHEHAGPFWDRDEKLSEEYEDWEPYGMTRRTFEACMRWNQGGGDSEEKRRLARLLGQELAGVEVAGEH